MISSIAGISPCPEQARSPAADRGGLALPPRPPLSKNGSPPDERAWHAQVRLYHRHRHLTDHGKRTTVANVAVARELAGFLWAAMTHQPLRITDSAAPSPSTADQLQEAAA